MDPHLEHFAAHGLSFPFTPDREGHFRRADVSLFYAVFGAGPTVVLLHGGMGNCTNWGLQIEPLTEAGYQVVVLDTRGHGRSTTGAHPFSYRLFAEDLLGLLGHLGLDDVRLVGWSDGACTALELARLAPTRVSGVVFFACNVTPEGTKPFEMTATIGNCLRRNQLDFERLSPGPERFEDLGPRLAPMQKNEPNYSAADLAALQVRVAVLHAEHDEFILEDHARWLSASLPRATFQLMTGVSHFAPIQNPEKFHQALRGALEAMPLPGVKQ